MIKAMVVFVPDPYLALYFKHLYDNVWKEEVDGLLVQVNGARPEVVDFIADLYKDEFVIKHYDHSNQGIGFDELYKHFKGDVLVTLCSDNFIYKKGVITSEIERLKSYDVVGSKGLHATPPIMADRIDERLGLCRINPFMSFWKADKLKQIEPFTFQSVEMEKGSKLEHINMDYEGEGRLDVMTDMTIKFMSQGNKAFIHGADNLPHWIHASGLSSGVYGHLMHSDGKNMAGTTRDNTGCRYDKSLLGWLLFCYQQTVDKCLLKQFNEEYLTALKRKAEQCKYSWEQILSEAKKKCE